MSELGPLPEQPFVDWLIPTMDLRDAIRIDHDFEPLYEEPFYEEPSYGVHNVISSNKDIFLSAAVVLAVLFAWQISEGFVIGFLLIALLLGWISKKLFVR